MYKICAKSHFLDDFLALQSSMNEEPQICTEMSNKQREKCLVDSLKGEVEGNRKKGRERER